MLRNIFVCVVACLACVSPAEAALVRYGVLIGRPVAYFLEPAAGQGNWPHYVVDVETPTGRQRAVINVFSRANEQVLHRVAAMAPYGEYRGVFGRANGLHYLPFNTAAGASTGGALDILRHPGVVADLRDTPWSTAPLVVGGTRVPEFDRLLAGAQRVYIFGEPYTNTNGSRGIHDVHQNQGNVATSSFARLNGVWQDGAMVIEYAPSTIWIPLPYPPWASYETIPNRTLVVTRFQVQQDFTDGFGYARAPITQDFAMQVAQDNTWTDYGPFQAGQLQVDLTTLSGNPDLYIQTGAVAYDVGDYYRARSTQVEGANEFLRDFVPGHLTYVSVKGNGVESTWNVRIRYVPD